MLTRSKSKLLKMSDIDVNSSDEADAVADAFDLDSLVNEISELRKTVEILASTVANNNSHIARNNTIMASNVNSNSNNDLRSYISHWKELGGSNLFFFPDGKLHPILFLKKIKKYLMCSGGSESGSCCGWYEGFCC